MKPVFSIVIPVYNAVPYLHDCLRSVLSQTFADWEAICVDDGSTDTSGVILDGYTSIDGRIRVIHQQNSGVGSARNAALEIARGEWIWFVDADDMIHPKSIEWLWNVINRNPDVESIGFYQSNIEGNTSPIAWPNLPVENVELIMSQRDDKAFRIHRRAAWGVLVRLDRIGDLRFKRYVVGEDAVFHLSYFWKTSKWIYVDAPLYFYRNHRESAMHQISNMRSISDSIDAEVDMIKMFIEYENEFDKSLCEAYLEWNGRHVYMTLARQIACLPSDEGKKVIEKWAKLQYMQMSVWKHLNVGRRLILFIVTFVKSVYVFKWLVVLLPSYCKCVSNNVKRAITTK